MKVILIATAIAVAFLAFVADVDFFQQYISDSIKICRFTAWINVKIILIAIVVLPVSSTPYYFASRVIASIFVFSRPIASRYFCSHIFRLTVDLLEASY